MTIGGTVTDHWEFDILPMMPEVKGAQVPKDQEAVCYVCGEKFTTYRSLRTLPPTRT